ncbi:hypothetical protein O1611_g3826 [Lasiodiplodia mahajangana]|uniref:Uncharacterized protein n=1 Tax=Lasiodiplodia mahajangana TaxID=1108764 RepID=A0ACC2JRI4_9PEZI|nr:hypothetical protein O1611_g3826 [Lasiodiplodia mahajangana]
MKRIDVHHHFLPPQYALKLNESGQIPPGLRLPSWDTDAALDFLDRNSIQTAILSLSAPGLGIVSSPEEAQSLARSCNEYAAEIKSAHPDRFGFFATLPLDNVTAGLEELNHAFDVLGADGVTLFTSYNGKYLGSGNFKPLWHELDKRKAVVFVHPATPKEPVASWEGMLPPPVVDFPHETTRAAVNLITSNTLRDYPGCSVVLSHGGGTLPYVATRIANAADDAGLLAGKTADEFLVDAKRFYFDLALTSFSDPVALLTRFAEEDHILWGSDYPFARQKSIDKQLDSLGSFDGDLRLQASIANGAALKLFPRLGQVIGQTA